MLTTSLAWEEPIEFIINLHWKGSCRDILIDLTGKDFRKLQSSKYVDDEVLVYSIKKFWRCQLSFNRPCGGDSSSSGKGTGPSSSDTEVNMDGAKTEEKEEIQGKRKQEYHSRHKGPKKPIVVTKKNSSKGSHHNKPSTRASSGKHQIIMTSFFASNTRGFNNTRKHDLVSTWLNTTKPDFGCLLETRVQKQVSPAIIAKVFPAGTVLIIMTTIVWVESSLSGLRRITLWQDLVRTKDTFIAPTTLWVILGDFNEILAPSEHSRSADQLLDTAVFLDRTQFLAPLVIRTIPDVWSKSCCLRGIRDLNRLASMEEKFYQQKSHINWLQNGDRNTAFFQRSVTSRRSKNNIYSVNSRAGITLSSPSDIKQEFVDYFQDFLQTPSIPCNLSTEDIQQYIDFRCPENLAQQLVARVSPEEIKHTLFSMPKNKSSGPDGFTPEFFQASWAIIGPEFVIAFQSYFLHGFMPRGVNATTLTLIPKVEGPTTLTDYRPIACCNVIYKVISKILANRLLLDGFFLHLHQRLYHPLCSDLKLNHLSFADDMSIFMDGTTRSLSGVLSVLDSFADIRDGHSTSFWFDIWIHNRHLFDVFGDSGFISFGLHRGASVADATAHASIYHIWLERNRRIHQNAAVSAAFLQQRIEYGITKMVDLLHLTVDSKLADIPSKWQQRHSRQ
uniref:Endonuclease/exonuclease/phosphatase domain-containing protein n=1 Tax=Boechera stricta TaxID=72658 RepID=K4FQQ8_BOEST|nr:hypothetical protein 7G9.16 [Boechera stricta]